MTATIVRSRITAVFHLKATIALVLLGLGCLAGVDDVEFHEVELADSVSRPTDLGALALNQIGSGTFHAHVGWAGFEVAVAAGDYELRAWGETPEGGQQDTILYLYGPKSGGGYPQRAIGFVDDADAATEALALQLALDGTYRIVVTTFENWRRYPTNVSRGTFHVVACPAGQCAKLPVTVPTVPAPPRAPS